MVPRAKILFLFSTMLSSNINSCFCFLFYYLWFREFRVQKEFASVHVLVLHFIDLYQVILHDLRQGQMPLFAYITKLVNVIISLFSAITWLSSLSKNLKRVLTLCSTFSEKLVIQTLFLSHRQRQPRFKSIWVVNFS